MNTLLKNKNLIIAGLIFLIISLTYLATMRSWYLEGDDWATLLRGSLVQNTRDVKQTFKYGDINHFRDIFVTSPHGSLEVHTNTSFLTCYYRPVLILFHSLLYKIFHANAYMHFMFVIFLHALIAGLLCYLFLQILPTTISILASLYFGFHPTLWGWIGKVDANLHQISLLLAMLTALMALQFYKTSRLMYLIASCCLFSLAIFTRETLIIVPAIILVIFLFSQEKFSSPVTEKLFLLFCSFSLVGLLYLIARYLAYPIDFGQLAQLLQTNQSSIAIATLIKQKIAALWHFAYDAFWLQWFPWTTYDALSSNRTLLILYKLIKGIVVLTVGYGFLISPHKKIIIGLLFILALLFWPFLFTAYKSPRFYYETLPVTALIVGLLVDSFRKNRFGYRSACAGLAMFIAFNVITNIFGMNTICERGSNLAISLHHLKDNYQAITQKKSLFFLNFTSALYATSVPQAVQLLDINRKTPALYFGRLAIHNPGKNACNLQIEHQDTSFRLRSVNTETWLTLAPQKESCQNEEFLAYVHINHQVDKKIYDISFALQDKSAELLTLLWLPDQQEFWLLPE